LLNGKDGIRPEKLKGGGNSRKFQSSIEKVSNKKKRMEIASRGLLGTRKEGGRRGKGGERDAEKKKRKVRGGVVIHIEDRVTTRKFLERAPNGMVGSGENGKGRCEGKKRS